MDEIEVGDEVEEEPRYSLDMKWNIVDYLPEISSVQKVFNIALGGYIQGLYEKIQEIMSSTQVRMEGMLGRL